MSEPTEVTTNQEKAIFSEALEIGSPEARAAYLKEACGESEELRQRVEELLEAYNSVGRFIPSRVETVDTVSTATPSPVLCEAPGTMIGRYKLLQLLGEGGFGAVYMAEQREPVKRRVALKIIKLGMDTKQVVARFEAERQALALMDHPNIAKVLDAGATATGRPYFVMELVRGVKITDFCDQNNLPTRERLQLFVQVCHAVQHAHQKGIIHRDLKPSNILVTLHDGVPVPKVIDFGIAKATTDQQLTDKTLFTAVEQFIGTPAYMSPEQAEMSGLDIDTRTDIYALGVLLYELLTGKTPFDTKELMAAGVEAMRRAIREREPARPSTRLSTLARGELAVIAKQHNAEPARLTSLIRGDLDWIVMKALEKDRSRRYDTADALAMDVQRHLNHEPILARRASTVDRALKWARRRPAAAALAAVIAAAGLACAVLAVYASKQAVLAMRKSTEAERARQAAETAAKAEQQQRQKVQRNVVRQYVANGTRLMNQGDLFAALLWYVEALRLDAGDAAREAPHRIRITSILGHCPKLLNVFTHGATNMLYHAEFSPDGNRLVTASDDSTARVWDVTTGRNVATVHHDDEVNDASFSPDGLKIVTPSRDHTARVSDSRTGALLHSLGHADTVWRACFNSQGRLIATACQDGTAQLWNAETGERVGAPLPHESRVDWVTFSPDGRWLGTATASGVGRVWEVATGIERLKTRHNSFFCAVTFSPDSQRILTCDGSNVRVWDVKDFKELAFSPLKHGGWINETSFSPDGTMIVSCGDDFTAQVWDANTGQPRFSPPVRHSGRILGARISPDGRSFVTAGEDKLAQLWSTRTGEPIGPSLKHILHVKFVRFNPDGRRLLFNSCDQAVRIWDLATSEVAGPSRPVIPNEHQLTSPNGQYRLVQGEPNVLFLTDGRSGRQLAALPHTNRITYASFSADGRSIITACEEDNAVSSKHDDIFLWEVPTGRRLNKVDMAQSFALLYVGFSPGARNQRLLTCGFDFCARVWDARTGQPISPPMRHGQRVSWGAFSPDGQSVVTASWDKTARVWEAYTGNPLTAPLQHRAVVSGAFWSNDGTRLNTVTKDGYLQVWDLASSEPLTVPRRIQDQDPDGGAPAGMSSLASPDELPWDLRPVTDLVRLSQMLAVAKISADGNVLPLESYELTTAWELLRKKYPNQFLATPAEIAAWHGREARDSEAEGLATAATFHRERAKTELQPPGPQGAMGAGQLEEARRLLNIPARDPRATDDQIDLSHYYNLGLHDSLDQKPGGVDLSSVPDGLHEFGGVLFDVRGLIHLMSRAVKQAQQSYPESVNGIPVGRKCKRLHFLHAARYCPLQDGLQIGSYWLNFADGQRIELPILSGQDVADWWIYGSPISTGLTAPVWTAPNRQAPRGLIGLFKSTKKNPRPDSFLVSIDFVSKNGEGAPFLVALSVE